MPLEFAAVNSFVPDQEAQGIRQPQQLASIVAAEDSRRLPASHLDLASVTRPVLKRLALQAFFAEAHVAELVVVVVVAEAAAQPELEPAIRLS